MKTIAFVGANDKTDLILYIARTIALLGKNVLVIDATINEKARYIVPTITPSREYITRFEDFDVAVGFEDYKELYKYMGISSMPYDMVLIDVDSIESLEGFEIDKADKRYFVTTFDLYSLRRGIEILSELKEPMVLGKILFAYDILKEDDEYLNYLAMDYKIEWDEYKVYFPTLPEDTAAMIENQRISRVKIRKLSNDYKESLMYVITEILGNEVSNSDIKKAFKFLEREI